eukprot:GHVN01095798.1.p1 GENE.GHVN01095798.1~~GHVN01095798.1.p1  ORF type:complete len:333 (-),score=24.32 GHVN01095798.1:340-1338(-)
MPWAMGGEIEIRNRPGDGITKLMFSSQQTGLLWCASWDKTIRAYDVSHNTMEACLVFDTPILDLCVGRNRSGAESVLGGGLDGSVFYIDVDRKKERRIGKHLAGVRALSEVENGVYVSGGWDRRLCLWDLRNNASKIIASLPEKVYSIDVVGNMLVAGMSGRLVYVFDMRNTEQIYQKRESSLKGQTRALRCFPDGKGFVSSSIEGRIAVDYFEDDALQPVAYAFKCHRETVIREGEKVDIVYPVHALALAGETAASGGGDGIVNFWNIRTKKRTRQFRKHPDAISSIAFCAQTEKMAVSSSYCFEEGKRAGQEDRIYVQGVGEERLWASSF